jgi:predicted nucleotidyltransferase
MMVAAAVFVLDATKSRNVDTPMNLNIDQDALVRICVRFHVTELSLFGSAARGTLRPGSDVDLLVVFEEGVTVTLFTLIDLQAELSGIFGRRVDLVPKGGLKPTLRSEVLADARVLYAA